MEAPCFSRGKQRFSAAGKEFLFLLRFSAGGEYFGAFAGGSSPLIHQGRVLYGMVVVQPIGGGNKNQDDDGDNHNKQPSASSAKLFTA